MRPMRSFVIAAVLLAVVPQLRAADPVEWRVVNVADGDTITCLDEGKRQLKARLHGIDAVVRALKDAGPGTLRCPSRFVNLTMNLCRREALPIRPLSADAAQATPATPARAPERFRCYSGQSRGRRMGR